MSRFMPIFRVAAPLCIATAICGCARDRDFAVVEPPLSRPYQAASAPPPSRVVGVQPVAGQAGVVQPVYQPQPASAVPNQGVVALPPASSTGAVASGEPGGQPYYAPPPLNVAQAPAPAVVSPPVAVAPAIQPTMARASVPIGAGVYPVGAGGMWAPTSGNQQIAIHQFATPTTGSSFVPSAPVAGGTASSMQLGDGVVPAAAAVPFASGIPVNAPPQNTRMPFLSDTGEHAQASRIPPPATASAAPINVQTNPPTARPFEGAPLSKPPSVEEGARPNQPERNMPEPLPPIGGRQKTKTVPDPVPSMDDVSEPAQPKSKTTNRPTEAPSKDPPSAPQRKSEPSGPPPSTLNLPNSETKKNSDTGASKKGDDLDAPPAPLKSKTSPPKKGDDPSPGMELPEDPPPPKRGSGS